MRRPGRLLVAGIVAVIVLVTSAGACQRDFDGELSPPDELGAAAFPAGARTDGLTAVYADFTGDGAEGTQCHRLHRLEADGTAQAASVCSSEPIDAVAAAVETWERKAEMGDYAFQDGWLWIRTVTWDGLAEELVLTEIDASYCGSELRHERPLTGGGVTDVVLDLVAGAAPPDAVPCG